ncbi:hypothetical protein ACU7RR_003311 [Providencia stuartii]|uniref:Fimbrial protein TcfA n=1 Tax=Providencia stuartii (strain MRSN 2154) TaxID=1157951 RepID=A0A140NM17_PROSM|nr:MULTISPECIES: hypothetical protein [Providencia]AFH94519.1 hypothetical protein S70_13395 [Providencia stuartii MRSN 2154]MDE8745850.1 hypothetical protein [Providencia thailandensis]MDE8767260.1 hypothetical protein [Providencia thailandensis]MDE8779633.1 hypothetical protein [Providencia thailandensis]MDE8783695.1 hypothetical protein [Providencia thailandensis]
MLKRIHFILTLLLMSITTSVCASPSIGIGSMYDVFTPETQSLTKRVYNTGTSTAFVRVEVLEIDVTPKMNQRESTQKEVDAGSLTQERLIVSPLRLIIPPSGFQTVRILWSGARDKERYFRIRFTPVLPEENDGFGMSKDEINQYKKNALEAGINVLTGYGSVVVMQPEKPLFNTVIDDRNKQIAIINKGNATIILDNIRYCENAKSHCENKSREIILPGREFILQKKQNDEIIFTLIEGDKSKSFNY